MRYHKPNKKQNWFVRAYYRIKIWWRGPVKITSDFGLAECDSVMLFKRNSSTLSGMGRKSEMYYAEEIRRGRMTNYEAKKHFLRKEGKIIEFRGEQDEGQ